MQLIISIHALREEGDEPFIVQITASSLFLSTPSARRATYKLILSGTPVQFLSTPSARRATASRRLPLRHKGISIHALREEGDAPTRRSSGTWTDFYPRPPRGGRPQAIAEDDGEWEFLSTPSARRATLESYIQSPAVEEFLSTPSARRATSRAARLRARNPISIHALREEGDRSLCCLL